MACDTGLQSVRATWDGRELRFAVAPAPSARVANPCHGDPPGRDPSPHRPPELLHPGRVDRVGRVPVALERRTDDEPVGERGVTCDGLGGDTAADEDGRVADVRL